MKLSSFFRMAEKYVWPIIKMIIVPLVAMFFTKAWNPSQLFSFIPEEYFYEAGLTLYVAALEGIAELAEHLIKKSDITIQCIWYTDERLENSHSKPQISMNATDLYTAPSVEIYNLTESIYHRFRLWPSADIDFSVWICYTISGLSDIIRCIYESQMVNHQFDIAPSIIF